MSMMPPAPPPPPHQPPRSRRRRRSRLTIGIVVLLTGAIVAAVGVGGYLLISEQQADKRAEERAAERERKAEEEAQAKEDAIKLCHAEVDPFVESLSDIDAQLNVGINQADYASAVRDASVKESRVSESDLSTECRSAFNVASDVLMGYAAVASEWNDCIFSDYCDTDTGVDYSFWDTAQAELDAIEDAISDGRMIGGGSGTGA